MNLGASLMSGRLSVNVDPGGKARRGKCLLTSARDTPAAENQGNCRIKGNISRYGGECIYHVPGGYYCDQTRIAPSKGERWFCSEAEARAAGCRRSLR